MNKLFDWITWVFGLSLVPYLILSFTELDLNPIHWNSFARLLLALVVVFWSVLISMAASWGDEMVKAIKYNKIDEKNRDK